MLSRILGNDPDGSSSDTTQITLSSSLSSELSSNIEGNSHFDSHLRQSIQIATAEIDAILDKGNLPPYEPLRLDMDDHSEKHSPRGNELSSTPISNYNWDAGEDISNTIGAAPGVLGSTRNFKFGINSTAFKPPPVAQVVRPISGVNRINPSVLSTHREDQTPLQGGILRALERVGDFPDQWQVGGQCRDESQEAMADVTSRVGLLRRAGW